MEEWRDIPGYEGLYQVSNMGRVKSFIGNEKILKPLIHKSGYIRCALSFEGVCKYYCVHRLVALSFIPNPLNKPEVNHKDGNKGNNNIENLEWCNGKENMQHALAHNLMPSQKKSKNAYWKGFVNIYTKDGKFVIQFETTGLAAEWLKENTKHKKAALQAISNVCRGKQKTAYGFIFKYSKEKI